MGPRVVIQSAFNPTEAAFVLGKGRATITGQAFVRISGDKAHKSVAGDVTLIPKTAYADERIAAIYGEGKLSVGKVRVDAASEDYQKYMRRTISNTVGKFTFKNVADGEYYIVAEIFFGTDFNERGVTVMDRVTIANGENVHLILRGY